MKKDTHRKVKKGDIFNSFKVISEPFYENGNKKVICECKCGKTIKRYTSSLSKIIECWACSRISHRKYKPGSKLNNWTILEADYIIINKNRTLIAKCGFCGTDKRVSIAQLHFSKSCGCLSHLLGRNNPRYKGGEFVPFSYFSRILRSVKKKKYDFDLDIEFLDNLFKKQDRRCALTNLEISFNKYEGGTASLDRIDSSKGYIKGNVQWVHQKVNLMKSNLELEEFLLLCELISANIK